MEEGIRSLLQEGLDSIHEVFDILVEAISQAVPFQPSPQPFDRVEFRGIGRQEQYLDVVWNDQVLGFVPTSSIHDQQAWAPRQVCAHLFEIEVHHGSVNPG